MRHPEAHLGQLPDFKRWRASGTTGSFGLLDYSGCVATPDLLFGFAELLCLELVLHDGNYFLAARLGVAEYEAWKERLQDPIQIQKVVNHLHIATILQGDDLSNEVAMAAAQTIAAAWTRTLFAEGLVGEAYGVSAEDAQVTLFRRRP